MNDYDCAFLVYDPMRAKRKDMSFDGNDNIGARVIADTLTRAGLRVGYVTPESASTVPIVLISMTSTHDIYAILKAVSLRSDWQRDKRTFKVIAGGFGMQNPTGLRKYVDYAAFGRSHEWIERVVRDVLAGREPKHGSLMDVSVYSPATIYQGGLYPHEIDGYKEEFTGCPQKCKFCHFSHAREYATIDGQKRDIYSQGLLTKGASKELMFKSLMKLTGKVGRVRVAIDGLSQRLRFLYGKAITNQDIIDGINHVGSFGPNASTMLVYNIGNFPTETDADYAEFVGTISQADPKYRVIFVLHTTPFRPSLYTPMQWEGVNIYPDWSKRRASVILDRPNFRAVHSFTLETPWSHLRSLVSERATDADMDALHAITHAPRLNNENHDTALKIFTANFGDKWTQQMDIDDDPPFPFVESYIATDQLRAKARKLRLGQW